MGKFNIVLACMFTLTCVVAPGLALAVEVAPRISDREIVESLTELKQQQKALDQRITDLIHNLDKRFEAIDKRFDAIDKRFESNDRRFESMMNWMLTLFGIVITLILGLLGYMIWDRRTALKPLREKMATLEDSSIQVSKQLEMHNPSGTLLDRLVAAFRELAKTDEKVADVLKAFSLL
ncbi:MAG: hypothetical protein CSA81_14420 [Acidobacteria bacterium]|nr:MAG: hypothetical protein CSA81_14420 [Acidobacteriota bacterium]